MESDQPLGHPAEIAGYRITRVLGSGGMATVYSAVQKQPKRIVALKVMKAGTVTESSLRRFRREIEILGRLHHPYIAQVFEAGSYDYGGGAMPYFAMEYVSDAKTIIEYVAENQLDLRERLKLFVKVCAAVEHGHQRKIIHRDLKPGNILIDTHGEPKIIDFGVARATEVDVSAHTMHTETGRLVGTIQYMSPEQMAATPQDLDVRCDVYALGVLLYRLMTNKPPHDLTGLPVYEAVRLIREQTPRHPGLVRAELRGDVETIILKAMDCDRKRRYRNAGSLGRDLVRFLAHKPIHARRVSMARRTGLFLRRNRTAAVVASIIFVFVLAGSAIIFVQRWVHEESQQAQQHILEREQQLRAEAQQRLAERQPTVATPMPNPFSLTAHTGRISKLEFSPDGSILASASYDHTAIIWDIHTKQPRATVREFDTAVTHLVISGDGKTIAASDDDGPVIVVDSSTGGIQQSLSPLFSTIHAMALSMNGQRLALAGDDLTVRVHMWESRQFLTGRSTSGALVSLAFDESGSLLAAPTSQGKVLSWRVAGDEIKLLHEYSHTELIDIVLAGFVPSTGGQRIVAIDRRGSAVMLPVDLQGLSPHIEFNVFGDVVPRAELPSLVCAAISPGGRWLACSDGSSVWIWNVADDHPRVVGQPVTSGETIYAVAVSSDGTWCAMGDVRGDITVTPLH